MKLKQKIVIGVAEDDRFFLEFDIQEQEGVAPGMIALEMLKECVVNLAEKLNVEPEFLAEVMYHDFTEGELLSVGDQDEKA